MRNPLERLGVHLHSHTRVQAVHRGGLSTDHGELAGDVVVWAAASPKPAARPASTRRRWTRSSPPSCPAGRLLAYPPSRSAAKGALQRGRGRPDLLGVAWQELPRAVDETAKLTPGMDGRGVRDRLHAAGHPPEGEPAEAPACSAAGR
ncbi:hypothetical protein GCM10010324_67630 [Streptomyces hiroshimensis]|uniref:Uncharacterized protein n=1 Tax=Streptomyces hiroshimensis TaxID=66424 RepID=A0ABQ2ZFR2_9ACTN|nr:hypothetical protein GCM10010324_67630 [Streptomyces hiroshimensis]